MKLKKKILFAAWACHNKNYTSYQAWYIPLTKVFKEVVTFDPQETMYRYGKEEMNKQFLSLLEKEQPDYVFLWLIYDEFSIDTLLSIKEIFPRTKLINFFGDDDALFYNFSIYYGQLFGGALVNQRDFLPKYKEEGIQNVLITYGVNTSHFRPLQVKKKYDVTFVGTPKSDRYEYIMFLIKNGINVRVFGAGWESYPEICERYGGLLSTDEYVKVVNESRINLSFSKNYEGKPHFKGRVPEVCACKSFVLSELYEGYYDFFKKGSEIVMFKTREELLQLVRYYLKNEKEREAIAARAHKKILEKFTLEKELRSFFKHMDRVHIKANGLPEVKKKVITILIHELRFSTKDILERVKNCDYIAFSAAEEQTLPHKEYFQKYSLEKSKKDICCCDYYVFTPRLGNYLIFQSKYAHRILKPDEFSSVIGLSHLMVRKSYFLKNIDQFKAVAQGEPISFITDKNTAFVTIPLVQRKKVPSLKYSSMDKVFLPLYENNLRALHYQRRLLIDTYTYFLFLESLFGKYFIARRLITKALDKILARKEKFNEH